LLVFLDANILIYHMEGHPVLGARTSARLAALHAAGDRIVVSELIRLECRVGPLKRGDASLLARYDTFFALSDIQVTPLSGKVCDQAAAIRASYGFRTPDALNLAAAVEAGCGIFLSHDLHLARFAALTVEALA
jgi:predicted nucleic acid-binding protein